ncbi:hypothetical protein AMJ85_01520 [candidate division BRC1 bacterium SM23_51]|nr:MAG: hypothetical protein AMJ85_01520 [candidate division BRC1 bacterium SM23_51]
MSKLRWFVLMISIVLSVSGACVGEAREQDEGAVFYVSMDGNDAWSGRPAEPNQRRTDGPFATIERARQAIRRLKEAGRLPDRGVTVYMRGGTYPRTKTFQLTADDNGAKDAPIVYRAHGGEEVRLIGGREIAGFKPIDDPAILSRIDKACRGKILQVDLKAQGISDFGQIKPRGFGRPTYPAALELFFQDKPMTLARWPNRGWAEIAKVPAGKDGGKFTYEGDRPKRWAGADDVWVHGYWTYDWADSYEKVKSIDTQTREIATHEPHGVYGYSAKQRFYALNLLEELDEAGEWYLDRNSGVLYFWPPAPIDSGKAFVSLLEEPMISMQDVSYVTVRGLTFECTRGNAVELVGGTHNLIAGCTFRNIGNGAVTVSGGTENGVLSCDIYETGDGGIGLSGGDRMSLTPAGNYATNNHIHNYSRWVRTYRPAVHVSGVGNRVSHNLIHDAPHSAILLSGNDHTVEFNEIHHVCRETGDVGAFYMGRDWTMRGNVIRHNFFHHLGGVGYGSMGVYLDDAASGATVFGNVFYKTNRAAFVGGGQDNTVGNNIFVDCNVAVHIDARGLGWAKRYIVKDGAWGMYKKLEGVNYNKPPYSTRYPTLATILEDDPAVPRGNAIVRNVCYRSQWLELQGVDRKIVVIEDNLTEEDPGFVDAANMNFQLKDDSPAYKLGFKRIPVAKIGLYKDEYRSVLPTSN